MLGVCVGKMKVLTVPMETVTMSGAGRYNMTYVVHSVHEIKSQISFLSKCLIFGGLS